MCANGTNGIHRQHLFRMNVDENKMKTEGVSQQTTDTTW